jgi:hypothetical protein
MKRAELVSVLLALALGLSTRAFAQDLFCTTTTFESTGSTSTMLLDAPYTTSNDLYTIHGDAVARRNANTIFVINRYLADNVLVLDAGAGYAVVDQYSTGLDSNPQDLEVVRPGRAYVTRLEETTLWVVEPLHGTLLTTIDLAPFADADGIPEMSQVAAVGDFAFVSLQRLDRLQTNLPPAGGSCLVVIDTRTDQPVDANVGTAGIDPILLPAQNPSGDLWYDRNLNRLLVICSGEFPQLDGGLAVVNPFTRQSEGLLTSEAQLGGNLQAARLASSELGWAIVSNSSFQTLLLRFDLTSGAPIDTVLSSSGFDLSDLEISQQGKVYVSDRNAQNPGIRIYDAFTGAALAGPIGVGLPPFDLVLRDGAPEGPLTDAPPARGTTRLFAWPNPFNPRVNLELRAAIGRPQLSIFDARGRLVTKLRPSGGDSERLLYHWDGRDAAGKGMASGIYWARPAGQSSSALKLSLVR